MFEMHLISGTTDTGGRGGTVFPCQAKCKNPAPTQLVCRYLLFFWIE